MRTGRCDASKRVIGPIPLARATIASHVPDVEFARGFTVPVPVMTTRLPFIDHLAHRSAADTRMVANCRSGVFRNRPPFLCDYLIAAAAPDRPLASSKLPLYDCGMKLYFFIRGVEVGSRPFVTGGEEADDVHELLFVRSG